MKVPLFDGAREFAQDGGSLLDAARSVLERGDYILGGTVASFEREVEEWVGAQHAIGVASGTDALLLSLKAIGVGPGDRVLTTPFTFFATAGAIVNAGAEPVFADVDPATLNLSPAAARSVLLGEPEYVERLGIDPRTIAAVVPVHLFGLPADVEAFEGLAQEFGIGLCQDAAQAMGSRYGELCIGGRQRDVASFSFFPTKNLGGFGDGGMVVTSSDDLAERVRILRSHGARAKYVHGVVGTNSRLDAIQAALLSVRLPGLDAAMTARERVAYRYDEAFAPVPWILTPAHFKGRTYHQYQLRVLSGLREVLRRGLEERGVNSAVHYPVPLHLQEAFARLGYRTGDLPESEQAANEVLSLPIFPTMRDAEQGWVISSVLELLRSQRLADFEMEVSR